MCSLLSKRSFLLGATALVAFAWPVHPLDAGITVTADPDVQYLVEDSKTGHITFTISNSMTITSGGNDFTVPVQLFAVDFLSFTWVGGDPVKDDKPVNPRWMSLAGTIDPFFFLIFPKTVYQTGNGQAAANVDFAFDTLPKHTDTPSDFDSWSMHFVFDFHFPATLTELADPDPSHWTGFTLESPTPDPLIFIYDQPEPASIAVWLLLSLTVGGVALSRRRKLPDERELAQPKNEIL